MMKKLAIYLLSCSFLILSACKEEGTDPSGGNELEEFQDLRAEYTVRTLTEAFEGSGGATIDINGFIYVANFGDQLNNANGRKVSKVDPNTGEVSVYATGLNGASGNYFDSKGNLFQSNIRGNSISIIPPGGLASTFMSTGVRGPVGIAIDQADNLFVCNCGGNTISKISPEGQVSTFVQSNLLNCPNGITIDESGNLYSTNFNNDQIFKITPDGTLSKFSEVPSSSNAHIAYRNNTIYVVGRQAGQVYAIDELGQVSIIAGTGISGDTDGSGDEAEFYIPNGITVSLDGNQIYVVDRLIGNGNQLNPVVVRVIEKK